MNATDERIRELSGELAGLLAQKFLDRPVIQGWAQLKEYLHVRLVALSVEEVRVMFLDVKNHLIADEVHATGSIAECPIHIRELVHRALNLGASALILAHNHPSGDPTPSTQDIRFTNKLVDATRHLGIQIHDHIIVGGAAEPVSMRSRGLLNL